MAGSGAPGADVLWSLKGPLVPPVQEAEEQRVVAEANLQGPGGRHLRRAVDDVRVRRDRVDGQGGRC